VESARVVEVLHDRGEGVSPRWLLGSGFVVKGGVVITAAHNLGGSPDDYGPHGTVVRCLDGVECAASVLARSESVDLALLAVPLLRARPAKIGRVDRDRIDVVRNVMAAGFPNYKYAHDRPVPLRRQPAQPSGFVPTVEDFSGGELTLKIEAGEPATPSLKGGSPWEGLSGAGVVVGEHLLGVAIEHHLAEGMGALRVVPLTRLADLPGPERALFCAILSIDDPTDLPVIDHKADEDEFSAALLRDLKDLLKLSELGLLGPGELKTLRITAVKEAKGWK
jgi:hypothetical protein